MINPVKKKCLNCGYERQPEDEPEFTPVSECPKCHVIYEKVEKWLNEKEREEQRRLKAGQQSRNEKGLDSKSSTGDSKKSRVSKSAKAKIYKTVMLAFSVIVIYFAYVYVNNTFLDGDLNGEVFIVTQGGQAIRLALVEVRAIPNFQEHLSSTSQLIKKQTEVTEKEFKIAGKKLVADFDRRDTIIRSKKYEKEMATIRHDYKDLEQSLKNNKSGALLYVLLSPLTLNGVIETKSDSDGKFTIRMEKNTPMLIAAHGTREALNEDYYWIIPISLEGKSSKTISLNNDNMYKY